MQFSLRGRSGERRALSRSAVETLSPAEALAREFGLRRNPFLADARIPDQSADGEILARLVEDVLGSLQAGHLLTVATGDSRPQLDGLVDRLARAFGETLRFLSLHGDKLDLAGSRAPSAPGAPARLHQSIDNIEFVVQSAIRQSVALERAGLLIDQAHALDQGSLLALLDFLERSRSQRPPVQLVLVGMPGILELLTDASCARFGDMTAQHFELDRLKLEESHALVAGRLAHAGADAKLFPAAAVDAAHELVGGYRDALLELAVWALWVAGERGESAVTPAIVSDAADLALAPGDPGGEQTATAASQFRPGKLAAFKRPRVRSFAPPAVTGAPKSSGDRTGGETAHAAPPTARRRGLAIALAGTAAAALVVALTLGWIARQPDASREAQAPLLTGEQPSRGDKPQPAPAPRPEQPLESLPPVDETFVDEPAYLEIESGEVRLAESGEARQGDAPPEDAAAEGQTATGEPGQPGATAQGPDEVGEAAPEAAAAAPAAAVAVGEADEIAGLLESARRQIAERQLTTPAGDNARDTLLAVLEHDPDNAGARSGLAGLKDTYLRWGETAEGREQWADARLYYRRALELEPENEAAAVALERVRELQSAGPAAEVPSDAERGSALLRAARNGDLIGIAQQVDAGAALDGRDARGKTPLMWAAELGHLRAARQLEGLGADVNLAASSGDTALMYAARSGHAETVRFLLNNGAQVGAANTLGWTALLYAAGSGHDAVVRELLDGGADVDASSEDGRAPLMAAARNGNVAVVGRLVDAGADLDATDAGGWTALMYAAWQGHAEVAEVLMAAGAGLDLRNADGQTALTLSIVRQHREVIDRLVQAGALR
ncbi:MAG TPA: ankyrin repeat domain-containing protein [Gammaproteobacteria bacterium]|nr:ankyrin repeat domain-containing protein [Gammaproteobacteria bacterium]